MKEKTVLLNGFEVNINCFEKRRRRLNSKNPGPVCVEICRTVFADNPARMDYNDHKHNRHRLKDKCRKAAQGALWEK